MSNLLKTARKHFDEDVARARALCAHAKTLVGTGTLQDDVLRAGWMMAVGACDAYFCDAFADVISRVLRAKELESSVEIPDRLNYLKVPVVAVLSKTSGGWRWRMAARELIEDESVLSLTKIRELFNQFFEEDKKPINRDTIGSWIEHPSARQRTFGVTAANYRAANDAQQEDYRKRGLVHFRQHYEKIFQRRHDCIHNCDRPKSKPQAIAANEVEEKIEDVEFLVSRFHAELESAFPAYLLRLGFSATTKNRVCM